MIVTRTLTDPHAVSGAYSAHVEWREPRQPNGFISHYRLVYKKLQQDPTLNSTVVTALTVEVNGNTQDTRAHTHARTHTRAHAHLRLVTSSI